MVITDSFAFIDNTHLIANYEYKPRVVIRHSSNQGSVVTFDMFGKTVQLFVADAKYRVLKAWASGSTHTTDISEMENFQGDYWHINDEDTEDTETLDLPYVISDFDLQKRFATFKTDKTAKENTDILMKYSDTDAAHWCRSKTVSGIGQLDLPNIYELIVLYLESDRIDALDPTISSYRNFALGKSNTYGRFNFTGYVGSVWSSTEYSDGFARSVYYRGYAHGSNKDYVYGVVPVKELSIL